MFLVQKNLPEKTKNLVKKSKKIQETPRILPRIQENARNAKNLAKSFKRKANKIPRQLRLDQRTYSTTAVRATNQTIMF